MTAVIPHIPPTVTYMTKAVGSCLGPGEDVVCTSNVCELQLLWLRMFPSVEVVQETREKSEIKELIHGF